MAVTHVSKVITGAAGEYFAAAELSARGWIATTSVRGASATDVLAQHAEAGRLIAAQTKTAGPGMTVGLKKPRERPDYFVVPAQHRCGTHLRRSCSLDAHP